MPKSHEELYRAVEWARKKSLPLFFLGKGSNVLISDRGWSGLVVHMISEGGDEEFKWRGKTVEVPGGMLLNTLVKNVTAMGCAGMEELAGIPGTVGGAVVMNAGAFSSCIADTLAGIDYYRRHQGTVEKVSAIHLNLGYRTSSLKISGDIVLSARFTFHRTDSPENLDSRRKAVLARRREKQPLDFPNCGSVFKRPPGNFAGTLIEKAGLKGIKCGGASISTKHANFIVNTGGARADDVRHLICTAQEKVYKQFSVLLEPEVIFIGDFTEPLFRPPEENA
jgi:UDP-N-acetylmuramate dehydrogenase